MRPTLALLLTSLLLPGAFAQGPALEPACAQGDAKACVQAAGRLLKEARTFADSARATAHNLKACELNDGSGCNDYGVALINGNGVPKNPAASGPYYLRGCSLGAGVACRNYGFNMLKGQHGLARDSVKAVTFLQKGCDIDYVDACVELGLAERNGVAGRSAQRGIERLVAACDRYSARGCLHAGYTYRDSLGVPGDLGTAASYFKRSCDQNGSNETDPASAGDGCSAIGYAYQNGQGVARNEERAATFYRRGCELRSAYSCTGFGLITLDAKPPDSARAAGFFTQACQLNQSAGCANLGRLLRKGWTGEHADSARARRLLKQACDADFPAGCRWYAEVVMAGVGARADTATALDIYQKACDRRDASACFEIGYAWAEGRGRPKDERKALPAYEMACRNGNTFGCNNLGVLLRSGPAEFRDLARANQLFEQECKRDNVRACANLGYSYEFGRGVALDEGRAMELYKRSCRADDSYGCAQLKRIAPDSLAILGTRVRGDSGRAAGSQSTARPADAAPRGLWALVVGLSRYASSEIRPLTYARKDAESFARFLMSPQGGGFQADHVQLLVDQDATASALRRGLHSFLRRANEGDLVVIYFAGHGRQPGNAGGIPYFLTYDTDPREMAVTAVPMDELRRAVQQSISARYIVAFVDACHSGGVTLSTRGSEDNELINRYLKELSRSKETVVTLAASQENQESIEGPEYGGGHGAFTWHLIQGLSGEADRVSEGGDESGTVTLREVAEYVTRKVKASTRNLQEPSLSYLKWDPSLVLSVLRSR